MTKLSNVERIEKTVFQVGSNFTVKNMVSTGTKGKNDVKLHPVYSRTYNSTKYSDKSSLESLTVRTSDFLVFAYKNFQQKINEEIYMSYPHLPGFLAVLEQAVAMVNTPDVYTNNGVNPKYADTVLKSQPLGGGKTIAIIPHVIQNDQSMIRGVMMFLNNDDIYVEIDVNNLNTLWYILKDFNLYTNSMLTLMTGLVFDGGSVADSTPSFSGSNSNTNSFSNAGQPKRGIFGAKTGNGGSGGFGGNTGGGKTRPTKTFTAPTKNASFNDLDKIVDGEIPVPTDNEVPFTGGEETPAKKSPFANDGGNETEELKGGNGALSLNSIMSAADEIDVPDIEEGDGDIDFE